MFKYLQYKLHRKFYDLINDQVSLEGTSCIVEHGKLLGLPEQATLFAFGVGVGRGREPRGVEVVVESNSVKVGKRHLLDTTDQHGSVAPDVLGDQETIEWGALWLGHFDRQLCVADTNDVPVSEYSSFNPDLVDQGAVVAAGIFYPTFCTLHVDLCVEPRYLGIGEKNLIVLGATNSHAAINWDLFSCICAGSYLQFYHRSPHTELDLGGQP